MCVRVCAGVRAVSVCACVSDSAYMCVCVCVRACVRACVCMCASVRACRVLSESARVCVEFRILLLLTYISIGAIHCKCC